jgi:hypothetical protein
MDEMDEIDEMDEMDEMDKMESSPFDHSLCCSLCVDEHCGDDSTPTQVC